MHDQIDDDSATKMYEAKKNNYGDVFLKVIDKEALKEDVDYEFHMENIQKEKEISYLCNSEYTLNFIRDFETEKNIVFETEYCKTDLKEDLYNNGGIEKESKYNMQTFKEIIIDIAKGLKEIKEKGVVHRNIKPHNIFLKELNDDKYRAKIGDFSCAIYIKDIKDSEPMGTIWYAAPEIIKNLDYDEKCDMWSVGITLFETYFGVSPYGYNMNIDKINDMIDDEENFKFRKTNIPTLDILFKLLLQIDPEKRMSHSEFYDYVTNENFLKKDYIAINNDEKYMKIYEEILKEDQVEYKEKVKKEKKNEEEAEKQNIEKIFDLIEDNNIPDINNFQNENENKEEKYNNIIYYDTNIAKHKKEIYKDSDLFESETQGAFILCTNKDSLTIIKDEILKNRRANRKAFFHIITNGWGYKNELKQFLDENKNFKNCIKSIFIYCKNIKKYNDLKGTDLIYDVDSSTKKAIKFIKDFSSKDIRPFPLTKLVRIEDYFEKYKKNHKEISKFYGDLKPEDFKKNLKEIKKVIKADEKDKILKIKKEKILEGLYTFDLEKDLKNLDELIIKEYTKNTFYGDLNRWLMKGKKMYYEPVAYFTSRLMYSLNTYAYKNQKFCKENEKILHRGAKLYYSCLLPYERAIDKVILFSAFTSTSESDEIAKTWAKRGKEEELFKKSSRFSVIFHIKNNYKNSQWISNSINIQSDSKYKKEKEYLFQPYSFYKVKEVEINIQNHKADITLETIGKTEILEEKIKQGKSITYDRAENIMKVKSSS